MWVKRSDHPFIAWGIEHIVVLYIAAVVTVNMVLLFYGAVA